MLGTVVDSLAIIIGCSVGLILKKGIPERISNTIMNGLALCVLYIGISGSLKGDNTLITLVCMALGALIGEIIDIDKRLNKLGDFLERKLTKNKPESIENGESDKSIAKSFVTASLVFCVGAMSVVGALESGLNGNHQMLFTKAVLDGVVSIVFTTTLGIGVVFSSVAVFIYEGGLTLGASALATILSQPVINSLSSIGSLLIIGLALNMLNITNIKVANLLPAVFLPIVLAMFGLM